MTFKSVGKAKNKESFELNKVANLFVLVSKVCTPWSVATINLFADRLLTCATLSCGPYFVVASGCTRNWVSFFVMINFWDTNVK